MHAVHSLPDLVQMMCRAERLQPDIGEFELFFPQLILQLQYDLRLSLGAFTQPAGEITHSVELGVKFRIVPNGVEFTYLKEKREAGGHRDVGA